MLKVANHCVKWGRVLILSFLFPLVFCGISPPKWVMVKDHVEKIKLACYLKKEIPRKSISILDAGTGNGRALQRIQSYFKSLSYDVEIVGLDNGQVTKEMVSRDFRRRYVLESRKDDRVRFGDVFDDSSLGGRKFDFVIVNAPCNPHHTKAEIARASLKHLRDDGLMILRYFVGEDTNWEVDDLKTAMDEMNCSVIDLHQSSIPEGEYALSYRTFIIKKQAFKNSITEAFAKSLGDMSEQIQKLKEAA